MCIAYVLSYGLFCRYVICTQRKRIRWTGLANPPTADKHKHTYTHSYCNWNAARPEFGRVIAPSVLLPAVHSSATSTASQTKTYARCTTVVCRHPLCALRDLRGIITAPTAVATKPTMMRTMMMAGVLVRKLCNQRFRLAHSLGAYGALAVNLNYIIHTHTHTLYEFNRFAEHQPLFGCKYWTA